jgi:hypothetical protein
LAYTHSSSHLDGRARIHIPSSCVSKLNNPCGNRWAARKESDDELSIGEQLIFLKKYRNPRLRSLLHRQSLGHVPINIYTHGPNKQAAQLCVCVCVCRANLHAICYTRRHVRGCVNNILSKRRLSLFNSCHRGALVLQSNN